MLQLCIDVLFHRQHLTPCEAELTLSGHEKIKSTASNYWLGHTIQTTNHIFTGGLPQRYLPNQVGLKRAACFCFFSLTH